MSLRSRPRSRAAACRTGSLCLISARDSTEAAKPATLAATAPATPSAWMTGPAAIGPTALATDSDSDRRVLPVCSRSGSAMRLGR